MRFLSQFVFATLFVLLNSITLTVSSIKERCMIVSSNRDDQMLKADLKFQRFSDQTLEEGYRIVLHNTETHEQQAYQISEGSFRKEFQLTEHVVYRFCFKIVLNRYREIRSTMQYNADLTHRESIYDVNVTVPAGLLKIEDLRKTYQNVVAMQHFFAQVNDTAMRFKKDEEIIFEEQNDQMKTLTYISVIEIIVVLTFGFYQYIRLKTLIESKN